MASIGELVAKLKLDDKEFQSGLDKTEKSLGGFQTQILAIGGVLAGGFAMSLANAGGQLERMQIATQTLGQNLGLTTGEVNGLVKALEETNTYGSNAWKAVQTLLQTGILPLTAGITRLDQATGDTLTGVDAFILSIKDLGASAGVSSGTAIDLVTSALNRMNPGLLENLNVQVNLEQLWKENADTLKNLSGEALITAQRQIFLNAIMDEASKFAGVYDATYQTAGKNLLSFQDVIQNITQEIGLGMQPAFREVTSTLLQSTKQFRDWIKQNKQAILAITIFLGTLTALGAGFFLLSKAVTIGIQLFRLLTVTLTTTQLAMGILGIVAVAVAGAITSAFMKQLSVQDDTAESVDDLSGIYDKLKGSGVGAMSEIGKEAGKTAGAISDIKQQIEDENKAFNKQLAMIVDRRRENIRLNKEQLKKETEDFKKAQEQAYTDYKQRSEDLKKENEQRIQNLETSLAESLIVGSDTYEEDLANYQEMIEEEKLAGEERLEKLKENFEEETKKRKEELEKTTNQLKANIAEDEKLLREHAEVVGTINREMIDDEIEELVQGHQRRLAELNSQLAKEGSAWNNHFGGVVGGADDMLRNIENLKPVDMNDMMIEIDWGQLASDAVLGVADFLLRVTTALLRGLVEVSRTISVKAREMLGGIPIIGDLLAGFAPSTQQINADADRYLKEIRAVERAGLPQLATGTLSSRGGLHIVGERGAELVDLPQGSRVYNAGETRNMLRNEQNNKNIVVNNYTTINNSSDLEAFNNNLNLQLNRL